MGLGEAGLGEVGLGEAGWRMMGNSSLAHQYEWVAVNFRVKIRFQIPG